jgi:uncharacterized repeat protein (TIGR01451 family)
VTNAVANPINGVPIPIIQQSNSLTITYKVQVNQIPPVATFVTAATITFQYAGACAQSPIINSTLVNANVITYVPLLNVNKTSTLTNLAPGSNFTYTITIPNIGTTNTLDAGLNDQIPVGTTYVPHTTYLNGTLVPDIGPGATNMPFTVTTLISGTNLPVVPGVIKVGDTATVKFTVKTAASNLPNPINNNATIYVNTNYPTSSQSASANVPPYYTDLGVGIAGTASTVAAGGGITYNVTVTNYGPYAFSPSTNYDTVTLYLPLSLQPLSLSFLSPNYIASSGTYDPLTGIWSGLTLPSNGVVTLTISGTVSPSTTATNISSTVIVTPPSGVVDSITNNNTASTSINVAQVADIAVTISDGVSNVYQGETLTYTSTVVNLGPSTINSIIVSNFLSTNDLAFIPSLFSYYNLVPNQGSLNPANGVWTGLNLAAGDSVTLTLQATVLKNVSGLFTNIIVVSTGAGVSDTNLLNNTNSDVDIILTAPDVFVSKSGPSSVYAGTNFSYSITLTNEGFATASNSIASDVLPPGVSFVSASGGGTTNSAGVVNWNLGNLAVNASTNLTLTVKAPFNSNITNVATATANIPDVNTNDDISAPVVTTVVPLTDLGVGKSAPAYVVASSNFDYTISVTNFGPSTASGVVVTDTLPATLTFVSATGGGTTNPVGVVNWAVGTMNANQVITYTLTVKAPAVGSITNIAWVNSGTLDTNLLNNTNSPVVISKVTAYALSSDVSVTKIGPAGVPASGTYTNTIIVTNFGPATASNVVASDVLPTNVIFVSASNGGTTNGNPPMVNWNVGNLASNASINLILTLKAPLTGTITNIATVTSTNSDPNLTNNTSLPLGTLVTNLADLQVTNIAPGSVVAGQSYTNVISVTNAGPSVATNVLVVDVLPGGGTTNINVGTLPAGGVTNISIVSVAPGGGPLTNTASAGSPVADPNLLNNTNAAVVAVTPLADLAVGKVANVAGAYAGGNVTYTISVTNLGPSVAGGVVVTDALPAGVGFVGASGNGTTNGHAAVATWDLSAAALAVGQVTNVSLTVGLPANAPAVGAVTNVAYAGPTNGPPSPSPQVPVLVTNLADLQVTNIAPGSVVAGQSYTNVISVTNAGPSVATNVLVVDVLPGGGTTNINVGTLPAGGVTNISIVSVAPGGGPLTNTASAGSPVADPNLLNNTNAAVVAVTPLADLAVGKVANVAGAYAGGNVTYTISVTNLGPSVAGGVVVTDALPAGVGFVGASGNGTTNGHAAVATWDLSAAALAVGQVTNVSLTVGLPANAPAVGAVTNVAYAGPTNGPPSPSPQVPVLVTNLADLQVTNIAPGSVVAGQSYTNVISVTNAGPSVATNVLVVDVLPGGGTTNINVGTLPAGGVTNISIVSVAPGGGPLTNTASAGSPVADPNLLNNTNAAVVAVTPLADLAVGKVANVAGAYAGGNVTYTISVTNLGPSVAGGVVVTDALPAGVGFVGASGNGTTNGHAAVATWDLSAAALAVGQVTNVSLTVGLPANAPAVGAVTNVAYAGPTNGPPSPSPQVPVLVTNLADLQVTNIAPGSVVAGQSYTNVISVTNAGPSVATNVLVVDVLPGGGTTNINVGTLPAGGVTNISIVSVAPGGGPLTNTASAGSPVADPNLLNNTNAAVVAVTPLADLAVGKVANVAGAYAGGNVTYTISVTNLGPSVAGGVVVTDALPAGVGFVGASGNGTTNGHAAVATWDLSAAALAVGQVTNVTLTVGLPANAPAAVR